MKVKRLLLGLCLPCCLFLLCGCAASTNPLKKAEATLVPGLNMKLHDAAASDSNVTTLEVALYYRYLSQPMLAPEYRTLTVRRDESPELALVRALLEGPSSGHSDLKALFPQGTQVEGVAANGSLLYITFSEAMLDDDIPSDWQQRSEWQTEAPLLRSLAIQSVVASVTESFPYTGVQILVHRRSEMQTSLRLDNAYFLDGSTGLSEPQTRNEALLLTPQNTASIVLAAWQHRDYATLYDLIANLNEGEPKPSYQDVILQLDAFPSLADFYVSAGNVSLTGAQAVITAQLSILKNETQSTLVAYPLLLARENGIWKISYQQLLALMDQ